MKKIALLLAAMVAGSAASRAEYSISLDFPFVSDYVFRGLQFADGSIQPSIEFAVDDLYAGIWTSQPVTGGYANEFDFYMGYGFALSDTWSVDLGATYYFYPETPSGDEQFEPFVGLAGDLGGGLSASVYLYYETEFEVTTFQGGLGYSQSIDDTSSIDYAFDYGFASGSGVTDYTYLSLSATYNYAFTDSASGYAGIVYTANDLDIPGADDSWVYFITGVSIGF